MQNKYLKNFFFVCGLFRAYFKKWDYFDVCLPNQPLQSILNLKKNLKTKNGAETPFL